MCYRIFALLLVLGTTAALTAQSNPSFELYGDSYQMNATNTPILVAGDFNNDGKPDLVQCCNSSGMVFRAGNGDGTFQAPATAFSTPVSIQSLVAADVNGDGKLDLVAVAALNPPPPPGAGDYSLMAWLGNGNGTFQAPEIYATTQGPGSALVGNFFSDGRPDIAVGESYGVIDLFRNQGNGTFTLAKTITFTGGTYDGVQLVAGDLNGNGISDLALTVQTSNDFSIPPQLYVLWNDGHANFTQQQLETYTYPRLAISRLNGDGMMDLLVSYKCTPPDGAQYCLGVDGYYGQGNNKLFQRTLLTSSSGVNAADIQQIAGVDVNGDGYGDIVAIGATECNSTTGTCNPPRAGLFVWTGNADGSFEQTPQPFVVSEGAGLGAATMADFNRDGMMDFAEAIPGAGGYTQFFLNSTARASCGTYTINPTVTVCQPVDNTYSTSPVRVQATSFDSIPVTAMQEYVDYKLAYSQAVTSFNTTFPESPGTHLFVTKAWDASGRNFVANRAVTVYDGTPGPVCPAAPNSASICLPSGTSSGSPVLILANGDTGASQPTAAQLYIDGRLVVNNNNCTSYVCAVGWTYVQTTQNLSAGSHDLVFKVWDAAGSVYEAQRTIVVN